MKKFIQNSVAFLGMNVLCVQLSFGVGVDFSKSTFQWVGKKITNSSHTGKISLKPEESKIVVNKDNKVEAQSVLVMDMNSITVEDIEGEMAGKFLGHIKNEDFLETAKYPTSKLVVKKVDGNNLVVDLTIKDKTNEENIKVTQVGDKYEGSFVFNRTKYNMVYGSNSFIKNLGDKAILDDVEIKFSLVLKK